ncbi:CRISPR-associated protein Cas4 [Hominifimenecus sp. rT4P-3]|uniref:CRISPR-associated protein Cas4 n=1 Tax=Hominifimenecus sp. rT4P-3 TaxID=3242979 RepID=UPI003DA5B426
MEEDEYLMISGVQHFAFCRRQWALIHIENLWEENLRTVEGALFHKRAHEEELTEKRGNLLITRGMKVASRRMGVTGVCDVVEFHQDPDGVTLRGWDGCWKPYPVEYKKGMPKAEDADRLQLCAQAMCLEEMLLCSIPEGSLFYGENRRRERVELSEPLRMQVEEMFREMHDFFRRGYTPKSKRTKSCNACSLKAVCLPQLEKTPSVQDYLNRAVREEED